MIGLEYILKLWDMTQQELADKLGIKRQNIDAWIKGKRKIPKKHLPILAEIFNIPEKYFLEKITKETEIFMLEKRIEFLKNDKPLEEQYSTKNCDKKSDIYDNMMKTGQKFKQALGLSDEDVYNLLK